MPLQKIFPVLYRGAGKLVDSVLCNDATEFCQKLRQLTGEKDRLPTEAEWEYACRAGTEAKFYWGDRKDGAYAWDDDDSGQETQTGDGNQAETGPILEKAFALNPGPGWAMIVQEEFGTEGRKGVRG